MRKVSAGEIRDVIVFAIGIAVILLAVFLRLLPGLLKNPSETLRVFSIFFILTVFIMLGLWYFYSKRSDKLLVEEQGKTPLFQEKCCAQWYCKNWFTMASSTLSLTRFTLYDEFIIVRCFEVLGRLLLRYNEIDKVELGEKEGVSGLQKLSIYYHQNNDSNYMILWLKDARLAKEIIESRK